MSLADSLARTAAAHPDRVAILLGDSGASVIFAWHGAAAEAELGAKEAGAEAIVVDPATSAIHSRPRRRRRRSSTGPVTTLRSSCTPRARPDGPRVPN
jgi:basic membrane lipoprotein Med (substrate-binding protein (PBP1-ABC) superfamily)